ncbi:DUF305 domain-containing protein [Streptomyces sp. MAR4 CNX-425]|uniref:DUF305 domain-containing protein n=1 Tax=Streptomyces sp. MAR4 CNX-425 TaxID=3406343 RepID=UPI003B50572B
MIRTRTRTRSLIRRGAVAAAAGAAALVLAACGSDDGDPAADGGGSGGKKGASASRQEHNAADVAFAQGMIPHHRQAVEMADLAPDRAGSDEVRKLAAAIEKAQAPEIEKLSGWLASWGEDVPAAGESGHSMHDSGSGSGSGSGSAAGMMSAADMAKLEKASGAAFDTAFMEMMIEHHEGAVAMAGTERAEGAYGPARKMAGEIIRTQETEIDTMKSLLDKG